MPANVDHPPVLVIAGTSSGVGKTSVTCALMGAYAARGLLVQPYKVGPDFLDGKHHVLACQQENQCQQQQEQEHGMRTTACHRPSINLDGWMMGGQDAVLESFHRHSHGADICIVEGVMGLHDGNDGKSDDGSTAQIAKWLDAPVILVVDAHSMCRSVAAMVLGYLALDPKLRLAAVVVNQVNASRHLEWIQQALDDDRLVDVATGKNVLLAGAMPKDKQISIPERHLGLVAPQDDDGRDRFVQLARVAEEHLKLDELYELAQTARPPPTPNRVPQTWNGATENACRVGVAHDAAFNFYYNDNLQLLRECNAELVSFSPMHDSHLPANVDALYIGGGYPELYAKALQANQSLMLDIQSFAHAGGVVYAECGGLMYLSQALWTMTRKKDDNNNDGEYDRQLYNMCQVLPNVVITMTPQWAMPKWNCSKIQSSMLDVSAEDNGFIFPKSSRKRVSTFRPPFKLCLRIQQPSLRMVDTLSIM